MNNTIIVYDLHKRKQESKIKFNHKLIFIINLCLDINNYEKLSLSIISFFIQDSSYYYCLLLLYFQFDIYYTIVQFVIIKICVVNVFIKLMFLMQM